MKRKKIILSLFSLLLGLAFLIGSTGITVIIHSCHHCGDSSVHAGLFLSPEIPEDNCCESAINHCKPHDSQTILGDCCHFRIDRLKLTNYNLSEKITIAIPVDVPFTYIMPQLSSTPEVTLDTFAFHNKHGGRYLITYNCQYLS